VSAAVLDAEQVALLRHAERGWPGAMIIAYTEAGIRSAKGMQSGGAGWEWHYDTDARGVHGTRRQRLGTPVYDQFGRVHEVNVTWAQIRAAVASLPASTIAGVKTAYDDWHRWRMVDVRPSHPGDPARRWEQPWVEVDPALIRCKESAMGAAVQAAFDLLVPAEELALW
jgi:hypothetical protein